MNFYRVLKWSLCSLAFSTFAAVALEPTDDNGHEITNPEPIADTAQGKFEGREVDGVNSFLGIPFAASAAGESRWQEPAAPPTHEGVKPAKTVGPACLQSRAERTTSEDCLSLNVWTPELDGDKRPVMVWIHGGGLRSGSNDVAGQVLADPSRQQNPAVVVAINYRLGPLGFFAHRSLKTKQANFGLLDMVAALEWVQTNISNFGGDPDNVTIFGVSAGGMAVNMLMTSPLSKGLFHKAIAQSGYGTWPLAHTRYAKTPPALDLDGAYLTRAERQCAELVEPLVGRKPTREMLIGLLGQQLVDALHGFQLPYVDGRSLKAEPGILFMRNKQHKVPYITGGVSNEGSVMGGVGITTEDFAEGFGGNQKVVRQLYETDFNRDDNAGWNRVFGDARYLLSARVLGDSMASRRKDAWLYYIDFVPEAFKSKWLGTPHGMDGWLLFNGLSSEEPDIQELTGLLHRYWLNFAYTGNPNNSQQNAATDKAASASNPDKPSEQQPLPPWPAYSKNEKLWLVMSAEPKAKPDVIGPKLDLLIRRYQQRVAPALRRR